MKHAKVVLSLLLISSSSAMLAHSEATPYFNARSQSANLALEMVGQEGYINRYESDGNYTVFSLTPAYQQSFRQGDIACCLFGSDLVKSGDCSQLNISGSQVPNRGSKDWLADYFGLPTDFKSTIQFNPRISNVLVDANFFFGLDEWWHPGMYFRMHIPFVHTRWELDYCETSSKGVKDHPFGYFSGNNPTEFSTTGIGNKNSELLSKASDFFSDCKAPNLSNKLLNGPITTFNKDLPSTACDDLIAQLDTITYNDCIVFEPLNYARWAGCDCSPLTKSGVADWRFTLGYNAYMSDKFHVGFGLTGAAPTGNRPHGQFLFEPIIGNGNHWELGGQFTSHYRFCRSEDENKGFTAYLDVNLTHLFKTRQTRSFDLKGKPNSRYMLAQKFGETTTLGTAALQRCLRNTNESGLRGTVLTDVRESPAQFKNVFAPVANLTTVDVDVNIGAQIDLALMLNYTSCNWSFDLGYNLWARTCERIKLNCKCPTRLADGHTWALKGDAHVYGAYAGETAANQCTPNCSSESNNVSFVMRLAPNTPYPLGATQSKSTIHKGTNDTNNAVASYGIDNNPTPPTRQTFFNQGIDNPRTAIARDHQSMAANYSDITDPGTDQNWLRSENNAYTQLAGTNTAFNNNIDPLVANQLIMSSQCPVFITEDDIDFDGAATKGLSHKVFGHVSYQWINSERDYTPFLGFGGSGEFASNSGDCCPTSCPTTTSSSSSSSTSCSTSSSTCCKTDCNTSCKDSCKLGCKRCALSQWSVWIKGGVSFN